MRFVFSVLRVHTCLFFSKHSGEPVAALNGIIAQAWQSDKPEDHQCGRVCVCVRVCVYVCVLHCYETNMESGFCSWMKEWFISRMKFKQLCSSRSLSEVMSLMQINGCWDLNLINSSYIDLNWAQHLEQAIYGTANQRWTSIGIISGDAFTCCCTYWSQCAPDVRIEEHTLRSSLHLFWMKCS